MPKEEKGVYHFFLFGNKKKTITINKIIETVEQLKKHGMQLEDHELHKEGPWGHVCLTLGIQNNKNNRYRICDAFRQMARAVMEVFPDFPVMKFKTSKKKMAEERKLMAVEILQASVFDTNRNCAMCSLTKPPGSGPSMTNWIQCDTCQRWYHEQCLDMTNNDFKKAKEEAWNCLLCC